MPEPLPNPSPSPARVRGDWTLALAVFVLVLAAYVTTAAPGIVAEGDSSEYVSAASVAGIPHAPGYPTYMLLASAIARLVPAASLARALALVSAFFGAATCALVALLGARLARRVLPGASDFLGRGTGAVAAALLATATEFWNQSLGAEVYTMSTCLLAACLVLLFASEWRHRLAGAALAAGLAFGVHYDVAGPAVLLVAACAWSARRELGARGLARLAGAFALGLATFLYLPLRSRADPALDFGDPETPARFLRMLTLADMPTGKSFARALGLLGQQIGAVAGLAAGQWPVWVFVLAVPGVVVLVRKRAPSAVGAALAFVFVLDYAGILAMSNFAIVAEEVYELRFLFLPAYLVLALLAALGFAGVLELVGRYARLAAPLAFALALVPWARAQHELLDKHDDRVMREYGLALLAAAEGPALVFTVGDNAWMPLTYLQTVEHARPDVTVIAAGLLHHEWYRRQLVARHPDLVIPEAAPGVAGIARANLGRVNLYHADPRPQGLEGFQEVPSGLLMRILPNGAPVAPVVPPAPELGASWAPLDRRERSLRADTVNAYLRTAQWCRKNEHGAAAEEAARAGLAIPVPAPRLDDFHLVRAALWLELGDALAARGKLDQARAAWSGALGEGVSSSHVELARKRLAAFGDGARPGGTSGG